MRATTMRKARAGDSQVELLPKCRTGIQGLDEITAGGLPRGRTTLVCGSAGCGKTLLGMEFLVRGATEFDEPGVCISFEETAEKLSKNVASLGFDVDDLVAQGKLAIDYVFLERSLIEEAGEYDLEALFVRLGHAVESIGAKRVLVDSAESLFAGLSDEGVLRSELRRLFRWLEEKNLTAIVTGERGQGALTRHGLEEYISDCVILLEHQVTDSVFTRHLRVVKYRGSTHGTNEYPFLIDSEGISVLPVTSLELKHSASEERVSTGIPALDAMFGGRGYFRGSSILISGPAGTGKTSLAAQFTDAACSRGERCVMFSFEESASQVARNMRSIGIDLQRWIDKGLLQFHATRPTMFGLEKHLVRTRKIVKSFAPSVIVVDPVTALLQAGTRTATKSMLLRMIDYLKGNQITTLMTTLTGAEEPQERTEIDISSLADVWILLRDMESLGERNRGLYILKARGLAHSNQIREFLLTEHGIELRDVYRGERGVLTGSARVAQESREASLIKQETERKRLRLDRRRKSLEARIRALQLKLDEQQREANLLMAEEDTPAAPPEQEGTEMEKSRKGNTGFSAGDGKSRKARVGR